MALALAIAGLFFLPDPWRFLLLVCALVVEVGEVFLWIRFLRRYRVTTGAEGMIGERAEVIGPGRVRLRGEIWHARGAEGARPGGFVTVAGVDWLTLRVEPAEHVTEPQHGIPPAE
jgi:membrane protein implicated in regulation of membrane protease activity